MPKAINKRDFDTKVRPQDDFYNYVSGDWFKRNKIPSDKSSWGAFHILRETNLNRLHKILKELKKRRLKKDSDEAKLRDAFIAAMNMRHRSKQGLGPVQFLFDEVNAVETKDELVPLIAKLHVYSVDVPWGIWTDQDDKESRRMVLRMTQSGIGVPDRNYHVNKDKESKRIQDAYKRHIVRLMKLSKQYKAAEIEGNVKKIISIETRLAKASMKPEERRDTHKTYNKHNLAKLKKSYPSIDWKEYLDILDVPTKARSHIIVDQPNFIKECEKMLKSVSLSDWKLYMNWHILDSYAGSLGEDFVKANFKYGGVDIQGLKQQPELWKRSVRSAEAMVSDTMGQLYVKEYFPKEAKQEVTKLVKNLIKAYRVRINELDWMSAATKKKALKKLDTTHLMLGYPKKWESYKSLKISSESHIGNVLAVTLWRHKKEMKKLRKPTDPYEWHMSAPTVNAYYSPNLNQIVFPAGILQPPFFHYPTDEAVNYGAIGMVIGHELTHGFDDQGAKFDENGNLKDWWTKKDEAEFKKRTKILVDQYNNFTVSDGLKVNGQLTLGENIADLGGLIIAYKAFKIATKNKKLKNIDGLTPDQRFFIGYALTERTLMRPEFEKLIVMTDPHAPSMTRTNGPVAHMPEFYEAFDVKEGDGLYRPEKLRARIW